MNLEYVSAVDSGWLDMVFLPEVELRIRGQRESVVLIATESLSEGNYLLEKVRYWAEKERNGFDRILLEPNDPLGMWSDLFGSINEIGLLFKANGLIGVWNGCFMPIDFLAERVSHIRVACRAAGVCLLLPIFYGAVQVLGGLLNAGEVVRVPQFESFSEGRRAELLEYLVVSLIPSLAGSEKQWLAKELVKAGPSSRAEAEHWISYYAEQVGNSGTLRVESSIPPVDRFPTMPLSCPTRGQLEAAFHAALLKLEESGDLFQSWVGRPLLLKIEHLVNPFQSDCSIWWFGASVSALSSQLFDGVDPVFDFLMGFNVVNGIVLSAEPDSFFITLRSIRTVLQHGLVVGDARNNETLERVRSWCYVNCGVRYPARADWRRLTSALISDFDRAATRMREVLRCMRDREVRASITAQLQQFERRLTKEQWRTLLQDAISYINPVLDVEFMLKKYLSLLQGDLRSSGVARSQLLVAAQGLAEGVVTKESSLCPLAAEDLSNLGLEPSPLWGRAKAHAEQLWSRSPHITREDLLAELKKWLQSQ